MSKVTRGFTLLEMMVIAATIGISGSLALFGMSEQIRDARARSDSLALVQRLRAEHRASKEKMKGLRITREDAPGGGVIGKFATAHSDSCEDVEELREFKFQRANLTLGERSLLCFRDNGEVVDDGRDFDIAVESTSDETENNTGEPVPPIAPPDEGSTVHRRVLRIDRTGFNIQSPLNNVVVTAQGGGGYAFTKHTSESGI